jgi:F-type H+-transporting ATPase subunit epsilon
MGGIFRFYNNEATILTDVAEIGSDIDLMRANEARARAEKRLAGKNEEIEVKRAELALSKAIARISAKQGKAH